jgi:hypothetical protein
MLAELSWETILFQYEARCLFWLPARMRAQLALLAVRCLPDGAQPAWLSSLELAWRT